MSWKQLHKEHVIKNQWVSVRKDHVLLESGVEIDDFYIIERPNLVHVIAITKDGLFVCEKQYRYAINKDCLEICAGMIEANETPLEAAQRELLEETGYAGGQWTLIGRHAIDPSNMTEVSYSFLAEGVELSQSQKLEETEFIDVILLDREEIIKRLQNGEIISSLMATPLWQYLYNQK